MYNSVNRFMVPINVLKINVHIFKIVSCLVNKIVYT